MPEADIEDPPRKRDLLLRQELTGAEKLDRLTITLSGSYWRRERRFLETVSSDIVLQPLLRLALPFAVELCA